MIFALLTVCPCFVLVFLLILFTSYWPLVDLFLNFHGIFKWPDFMCCFLVLASCRFIRILQSCAGALTNIISEIHVLGWWRPTCWPTTFSSSVTSCWAAAKWIAFSFLNILTDHLQLPKTNTSNSIPFWLEKTLWIQPNDQQYHWDDAELMWRSLWTLRASSLDGLVHFLTGEPLLDMDLIPIFEFHSEAQLRSTNVDHIKWEIKDFCWQCLRLSIRKRDFKLWLRVLPAQSPGYPYGKFVPIDFDSSWSEVLNANQISFGQERLDLRQVPQVERTWLRWINKQASKVT